MSDRSESDDDEFESADEGDEYTDESSEEGSDEEILKHESPSEKSEISEVGSSQAIQDVEPPVDVIPEAIESLVHIGNAIELPEKPKIACDELDTTTVLETVKLEDVTHIQDATNTEEIVELQKILEDTKINQEEPIPAAHTASHELKVVTESIPSDAVHEDVEIPAEIANKISTRSISSNRGKVRAKPSGLGAKKLGAVKLSQPPESAIPAFAKLDSEETERGEKAQIDCKATSTYQQVHIIEKNYLVCKLWWNYFFFTGWWLFKEKWWERLEWQWMG